MLHKSIIGLGVLLLVSMTSVASNASGEVRVRYLRGVATYVSFDPSSVVQVALPAEEKGHRTGIFVGVFNRGAEPLSLGYENVAITTADGAPVKLVAYEQLEHQARATANWARFFTVVGMGLGAYGAERSAHGSISGTAHTSTPYGGVNATYSARYYDPATAQAGLANTASWGGSTLAAISQNLDATMARLDGTILRTTTIDPGSSFGGVVALDLPHGAKVRDLVVTVKYGGETHVTALNGSNAESRQASAAELAGLAGPLATTQPAGAAPSGGAATPSLVGVSGATHPSPPSETAAQPRIEPATRVKCKLVVATDPRQNPCVP